MRAVVAEAGRMDEIIIDSAGTGAWHVGATADPRSRAEAESRGIRLGSVARRFSADEFHGTGI